MTRFVQVKNSVTMKYINLLWNHPDVKIKRKAAINLARELIKKIKHDFQVSDTEIHFLHIMRDAIVFVFASWIETPLAKNSLVFHHRILKGKHPKTIVYRQKVDKILKNELIVVTDCVACSGSTQKAVLSEIFNPGQVNQVVVALFAGTDPAFKVLEELGVNSVYFIDKKGTTSDKKRLEPPIFPIWDIGDNIFFTRIDIHEEGAPD